MHLLMLLLLLLMLISGNNVGGIGVPRRNNIELLTIDSTQIKNRIVRRHSIILIRQAKSEIKLRAEGKTAFSNTTKRRASFSAQMVQLQTYAVRGTLVGVEEGGSPYRTVVVTLIIRLKE